MWRVFMTMRRQALGSRPWAGLSVAGSLSSASLLTHPPPTPLQALTHHSPEPHRSPLGYLGLSLSSLWSFPSKPLHPPHPPHGWWLNKGSWSWVEEVVFLCALVWVCEHAFVSVRFKEDAVWPPVTESGSLLHQAWVKFAVTKWRHHTLQQTTAIRRRSRVKSDIQTLIPYREWV